MGAHSHQNAHKVPQSSIRSPQNPRKSLWLTTKGRVTKDD